MVVLAFVPNPASAARVAAWSSALEKDSDHIEYICLETVGHKETEMALRASLQLDPTEPASISSTSSPTPVQVVSERCRKHKARILVTDAFALPTVSGRPQTAEELVRMAPCAAIYSLFGVREPASVNRILTVVSRGPDDLIALRTADWLGKTLKAKVTLATVESDSGEKADRAGEKAIRSLVHDSGFDEDRFEIKVVVDRLSHRGLLKCSDGHDLIICGRKVVRDIRPLRQALKEKSTTLVVKRAPPIRLRSLAEWFPRINPSDHADLLQELRQGSRWNTDYISMLALASAIATLGLMQNSPAVVIGSMLLAPMMTPMIGAGLAIAQANVPLARQCVQSIAFGLLLTLVVSFLLGLVTPARETLSPELMSRGSPNVLDLLIALFAAIAATIAMARPGIVGAIAGVAIATALVPPICAVGLSLSLGELPNAVGAMLLFATNLVAIIVASSFTFSILGVVTNRSLPRHRKSIGLIRWALVFLLIVLAGPLTFTLLSQLEKGRSQTAAYPVTRAVSRALIERVDKDEGVDITFMARPSVAYGVLIHIASDHQLPKSYGNELRAIVRNEMGDPEMPVVVVCLNGQWLSEQDDSVSDGE